MWDLIVSVPDHCFLLWNWATLHYLLWCYLPLVVESPFRHAGSQVE